MLVPVFSTGLGKGFVVKHNTIKQAIWFFLSLSLSSQGVMAIDLSSAQLEEARRMSQQALSNANQAYQAQKHSDQITSMNIGSIPSTQARLSGLESWINQAQQAQLLSLQAESGIKGILFVSFSMSDSSIKSYLKQASLIHGGKTIKLAIRGLDESNSLIKTQQRLSRLMAGVNAQVDIDPSAFERFNITQVPALVFYEDDALNEASCALKAGNPAGKQIKASNHLVVYGEVSLAASIEHILKDRSAKKWQGELTAMRDALVGKI